MDTPNMYLAPQSSYASIADMSAAINLLRETYGSTGPSHLTYVGPVGLVLGTLRPVSAEDQAALGVVEYR
jgi:hypothetical protein